MKNFYKALNKTNKGEQPRICVILHIFYIELWNEIKEYLKNLEEINAFDLYITIQEVNPKLENDIYNSFNENINIKIFHIEPTPQGADIWPFIYVINNINLRQYEIVYKLHTKRSFDANYVRLPKMYQKNIYLDHSLWRNYLLNEILGKENVGKAIKLLKKRKVGMVGFAPLKLKYKNNNFNIKMNIKMWQIKKGGKQPFYEFFAGTIFCCKSSVLIPLQNVYSREDFNQKTVLDGKFSATAYHLELIFGVIVKLMGMKIVGVNVFSNTFLLELLSRKQTYELYKKYVNKYIFKKEII